MLTTKRALQLSLQSSPEMPRIPELKHFYENGIKFRQGQLIMIAGRPGHQKSGFAMWLVTQWNLPTLYFAGDMTPYDATMRVASNATGKSREVLEKEGIPEIKSNIIWSFGAIRINTIESELQAHLEAFNCYPSVIVIDNLMDVEGAESEHAMQMEVMQVLTEICRETGSTMIILHHATESSPNAIMNPDCPPARSEIANKLGQKPELILTIAMDPQDSSVNVACVKNRAGPADAAARRWRRLRVDPVLTRFEAIS